MTAPALPGPFWLIGCGNMAGAMLEGWLGAGIDPSQLTVIRPSGKPAAGGVRVLTELPKDEVPALVMLGFKPQTLLDAAPVLEPALDRRTILISILAGAEQSTLRSLFPRCETVVRAMPNTPVRIGKGVIALYNDSPEVRSRAVVDSLMQPLGIVDWLADESLFDRITALTGCGPAFVFRFIDALAEAAATLGVPRDKAERFARAMVEGAGALAAAADENPGQLADRVASPGGSTRKGLDVLDRDGRLAALMLETLEASVRRDREMAEEARRG